MLFSDEGDVMGLCGLHKEYDIDNSPKSKRLMYPWYAEISVKVNVSAFHLAS